VKYNLGNEGNSSVAYRSSVFRSNTICAIKLAVFVDLHKCYVMLSAFC
jgi:hypothetical protein